MGRAGRCARRADQELVPLSTDRVEPMEWLYRDRASRSFNVGTKVICPNQPIESIDGRRGAGITLARAAGCEVAFGGLWLVREKKTGTGLDRGRQGSGRLSGANNQS